MENETEDKEDGEIYFPNLHDRMTKNYCIHTYDKDSANTAS